MLSGLKRITAAQWRGLFIFTTVCILILALAPMAANDGGIPHMDKVKHAFAFVTLWLLGERTGWVKGWPLAVALIAFGAFIEIAQYFTGYREASLGDLLADSVGVALGAWISSRVSRVLPAT